MNVYEKLNNARSEFNARTDIKKSGYNSFTKAKYFELSDFLTPILEACSNNKICPLVSFDENLAVMTIVDTEKPEDKIIFTSPMSTAKLSNCHPVQNVGACETYQRRYLYTMAFEIKESDTLDGSLGQQRAKPRQTQQAPQDRYINRDEAKGIIDYLTEQGVDYKLAMTALGMQKLSELKLSTQGAFVEKALTLKK